MEIVGGAAEQSMVDAVQEVKNLPQYTTEKGEVSHALFFLSMNHFQWVITDARHDSIANAYHTTVLCLSGKYDSIIIHNNFVSCNYIVHLVYRQFQEQNTQHLRQENWHL